MKRLLLAPLILALTSCAQTEIDKKVHHMCLSATDYKGCVESQKGSFIKNFFKKTTKSKINKKDLRKRCELGNESGIKNELVGVLEMVEACKKNLAQIGPSALEITEYDHIRCDQGIDLASYLICVTEESDWRPPAEFENVMKLAAKENCEDKGNEFTFNSATGSCYFDYSKMPRRLDTFEHKGKTYTASRPCGEGRWMQWMTYPSFFGIGGRVEELGCMNRREHEEYMRNYRMGIDSRPVIINNPAPMPQPIRSAPLQFDYNPPTTNYSSPFAPKQPSQIRLYNNNSPGGVQNCSRFGNTNSFNCY